MQLLNEFNIPVEVADGWEIMTDVRRIAPCMPGAYLMTADQGRFSGGVKVKVGPITAAYTGTAEFVELDAANYRAVLRADARDDRGSGNARADITLALTPKGDTTDVTVKTELAISGRIAQFGRGVITDISSRLIDEFVAALEAEVISPRQTSSGAGEVASRSGQPSCERLPAAGAAVATPVRDVASSIWPDSEESRIPGPTPTQAVSPEPPSMNLMSAVVLPQMLRLRKPALVLVGAATAAFLLGRRTGARAAKPRS